MIALVLDRRAFDTTAHRQPVLTLQGGTCHRSGRASFKWTEWCAHGPRLAAVWAHLGAFGSRCSHHVMARVFPYVAGGAPALPSRSEALYATAVGGPASNGPNGARMGRGWPRFGDGRCVVCGSTPDVGGELPGRGSSDQGVLKGGFVKRFVAPSSSLIINPHLGGKVRYGGCQVWHLYSGSTRKSEPFGATCDRVTTTWRMSGEAQRSIRAPPLGDHVAT